MPLIIMITIHTNIINCNRPTIFFLVFFSFLWHYFSNPTHILSEFTRNRKRICVAFHPLDKFEDDSSFVSAFLEEASGTPCRTMGCNFTRRCTPALKLLLFPHNTPICPRTLCTAPTTPPCQSIAKQIAW